MKKRLLTIFAFLFIAFSAGVYAQMPNAITISPEGATAWDELTLTFNANLSCTPADKDDLLGLATVAMHGAAILISDNQTSWGSYGVDYNGQPGGGYSTTLTNNGDDTYSMTFIPATYFKVPEGSVITRISAVFNNGSGWAAEGKDNIEGGCGDFFIPLAYASTEPTLKFSVNMGKMYEDGNFDNELDQVYAVVDGFTAVELIDINADFESDLIYEGVLDEGLTEGTTYNFKFRINTNELETVQRTITPTAGTNVIDVWWNDETGTIYTDVLFEVDMTYQIEAGNFDPATDYVDVAGTMNGWDGTNYHLVAGANNKYSVTIEDLAAGSVVKYKYRFNGNWDTSEFPGGGADRKFTVRESGSKTFDVYDNFKPGWAPVTLSVNMSYVLTTVMTADDFVDVAGSMNGWGASDQLWDDDADGIYTGFVLAEMGVEMQYKFRINASWDNDFHEFPAGGPARAYTVADTAGGVTNVVATVWFNDDDPAVAAAPRAKHVAVAGSPRVGNTLTASYDYEDVNGDAEGTSTYRWFRSANVNGSDSTVIAGAAALTYAVVEADAENYLFFEVTPVAAAGTLLTGTPVAASTGPVWPVSASELKLEGLSIYPNPVHGELNISNVEGFSKIRISNIIGQEVKLINVTSSNLTINTSSLNEGIYFVTFISENGKVVSHKIVKN